MLMGWGSWMCPVREEHHDLELERQRRSIQGYDLPHARDMCWRLAQLAQHQELILRAATRRIAELEAREALAER